MFRVLKYAIFIALTFLVFFWIIKSPGVAIFEWFGFRVETNIIFFVLLVIILTLLIRIIFNFSIMKIFQKYNIYQYIFLEGKALGVSTSEMTEILSILERGKSSYKHIKNIFIAKKLAKRNKEQEALKAIRKIEKIGYLKPLYNLNFALINSVEHNESILSFEKALKHNKNFIDNSKGIFDLIIKKNIVERYEQSIKILEKQKKLSLENQKILYKLNILQIKHFIQYNPNMEKAKSLIFKLVKNYPQFLEGYEIIHEHFDDASFIEEQMLNAISNYENNEVITIIDNFLQKREFSPDTQKLFNKRENKNKQNMLAFAQAKLAIKNKNYEEAQEQAEKIEKPYYKKLILAEIEAYQGSIDKAFKLLQTK